MKLKTLLDNNRVNIHTKTLLARNRTRIPHKIYLYEAEIVFLGEIVPGTVSDNAHAIIASFFRRIGKQMYFLKERDINKINDIRRAVSDCL